MVEYSRRSDPPIHHFTNQAAVHGGNLFSDAEHMGEVLQKIASLLDSHARFVVGAALLLAHLASSPTLLQSSL